MDSCHHGLLATQEQLPYWGLVGGGRGEVAACLSATSSLTTCLPNTILTQVE